MISIVHCVCVIVLNGRILHGRPSYSYTEPLHLCACSEVADWIAAVKAREIRILEYTREAEKRFDRSHFVYKFTPLS